VLGQLDAAISTGLRKGNQYALRWDMVDWKSRELHIPNTETKNGKPLHVPLERCGCRRAQSSIRGWGGKGRVFKSKKAGDPLENGRHWFDDGIDLARLKNFHWHDLRHTFASCLRMKGEPLEDMANLLGHESLTMTRRYAHLGSGQL
jgi:integrase